MSESATTTAYGSSFVATGPQAQASAEGAAGRSYHNIGYKLSCQTIGGGGGSGAEGVRSLDGEIDWPFTPRQAVGDGKHTLPILNEREETHGDFAETAGIAQRIKHQFYGAGLSDLQQEAVDMIATKLARIAGGNSYERDHWQDIIGYATLVLESLPVVPSAP